MAGKKDVRQNFVVSQDELEALEVWRQRHRVWSRSKAIRDAIRHLVQRDLPPFPSDVYDAPPPPAQIKKPPRRRPRGG